MALVKSPLKVTTLESVWGVADVIVDTNFSDCRMKCIITAPTGTIIVGIPVWRDFKL